MSKKLLLFPCIACVLMSMIIPVSADDDTSPEGWQGVAAGVKVGTLGLGADATVDVLPWMNVRATGNYLDYSYEKTIDNIAYDLTLKYQGIGVLLDLHPFKNGFRISGGAIFNNNHIDLDATPTESEKIGDHTYTPEQIGTISGKLKFSSTAPYFGIGYGDAVGPDKSFSFVFDLGVMYQSYDIDLSANGQAAQHPQFQQDLAEEEQKIQDDLDGFKIYPVLAFGVAYHF